MGKLADAGLRLRCVHCQSTETPLWRAGPDGPKTLCNACGVRYKKGKLVLYKDENGKITAVKREDSLPVHIPPAPKKASKKAAAQSVPAPSSPTDLSTKRSTVRKVPSEGTIAPAVGKKPRSRSRRANAGQLPGRYASKTLPESLSQWRSPASSPKSSPSSPAESPRFDGTFEASCAPCFRVYASPRGLQCGPCPNVHVSNNGTLCSFDPDDANPPEPFSLREDFPRTDVLLGFPANANTFNMDAPSLYQFTDPDDESMFPDMACLGLDCSADSDNVTLLPMPADPSSAEQFSFAFSGLGRDACIELDKPDRVEALRGLVLDRTCKVSRIYDATVQALSRLCEQRYLRAKSSGTDRKVCTVDDCRRFVRAFAHEQSSGFSLDELGDLRGGLAEGLGFGERTPGVMLSEKTAHSSAVESFKTLMDSTELAGFAEACMVELLAEDAVAALAQKGYTEFDKGAGCRVPDSGLSSKPIPTPA